MHAQVAFQMEFMLAVKDNGYNLHTLHKPDTTLLHPLRSFKDTLKRPSSAELMTLGHNPHH